MSVNINIQKLDHKQSELDRIQKINYNFSNILRSLHGELQTIREIVGIDTHNDLKGREEDNCHPLKAIAGLNDKFNEYDKQFKDLSKSIEDIQSDISELQETVEDHEERIDKLERG